MIEESRSVQKTKRLLKEALLEILLEYGRDDTKGITELCRRADISRQTFYSYYEDKIDFAIKVFKDIAEKFARQMIEWFIGGRENLEETSKKKNLLIDETERNLFYIVVEGNSNLKEIMGLNYDVFNECKRLLSEKNFLNNNYDVNKLDYFFRGYYFVCIEILNDYSARRAKEKLEVVFDIYDSLFEI